MVPFLGGFLIQLSGKKRRKKSHVENSLSFFVFLFLGLVNVMRVKIATSYPLDKYHCWFSIEKSLENQSIHQLAKQIVNKLELEAIPSNLKLLLEGYQLLPQTKIKEVLRDGDLITIKQNQPKNTDIVKKRKRCKLTAFFCTP
ncbi:uncharacterized protein B0P05DRAFT_522949 [Gilbertella persicaria]|uniref:uncharacterized protein n=1 Tax=Gilbertella persicaria TaxID=101096 RepID=UPI002220B3A6|nr:uncharacterized protein B0P05DRAFT_522949 [Gilbertella persicaria]KAI8098008.1 hypothetical protein B0P05DRAFT_522949 [Gilbertella persicaria]